MKKKTSAASKVILTLTLLFFFQYAFSFWLLALYTERKVVPVGLTVTVMRLTVLV